MPDEEKGSRLVDQITELTLDALTLSTKFDTETIERLRQLNESSGLTSYQQVVEALSAQEDA